MKNKQNVLWKMGQKYILSYLDLVEVYYLLNMTMPTWHRKQSGYYTQGKQNTYEEIPQNKIKITQQRP